MWATMLTTADSSNEEPSLRSGHLPPTTPRRGLDSIFGDAFSGGIPPLSPDLVGTGNILQTPRGPCGGIGLMSPRMSGSWIPPLSPAGPSGAVDNSDNANSQARSLGQSMLSSLNDSMHTSTQSQASPLLSLLYSPKVHLKISTVCTTTAEEKTTHDVRTLADSIGVLADVGLLGAKFDDVTHCKFAYVPARISVDVAGMLHLATGKSMRYWRRLSVLWGSNGMSSPRTVSPADWRVCEDRIVFFP